MTCRRSLLGLSIWILCATLTITGCSGASAQLPHTAFDSVGAADASSMEATAQAKRYRLPTAESAIDTGGAIILVQAPMEQVLAEVLRFDNYKNIFPRIEDTRVVARRGDTTDLYLRAPVLDGSMTIWAITRFSKPRPWGDHGQQVSSRLVKGNLDAWRGQWKLEPVTEKQTALRIELYIDVQLPVPDAWVTPELMWAAGKAVTAIRDTVEKGDSSVKHD